MLRYGPERCRLAIALSDLAGFVDAVGFLSDNGCFGSFISGNLTWLAVAFGTLSGTTLLPAVLIAWFVCGVAPGALSALRVGGRQKRMIFGVVTALLLLGATARRSGGGAVVPTALVLARGQHEARSSATVKLTVDLIYMPGALVRLGQGLALWLVGKPEPGWVYWGRLWYGLIVGAVLGAFLHSQFPFGSLWIAAA